MGQRTKNAFQKEIWGHYRRYKRDFPWRRTRDPYRILVSEVMLQQTQTSRVEGKYVEFLKRFPNFKSLAKAPLKDVLRAWSGLGYNRRALNLKKAAEIVAQKYKGKLPRETELLDDLPGIGPGTAGAIQAFAFNFPSVFIETNIRRVFIHFFFPKKRRIDDREIFKLIEESLPADRQAREWYWALMDYGAMLGRGQKENPNRKSRHYKKQPKFQGSDRQLRGRILRLSLADARISLKDAVRKIGGDNGRTARIWKNLKSEGFL